MSEHTKEAPAQEEEKDWYFTFGHGQIPDQNHYAVFHGTFNSAREKMVAEYGTKWSFQYDSAEKAGVERFNLQLAKPKADYDKLIEWIDNASYEQLLNKWRFAPIDGSSPFFNNRGIGEYYQDKMMEKKRALSHADQVAASKRIGWET